MPINFGNGIMVGEICESCIKLRPMEGISPCPHGNNKWPDKKTFFIGSDKTPGSLCYDYITYDMIGIEAERNNMIKTSSKLTDAQLNMSLYRKIKAMSEKEQKKLFNYWKQQFPEDFCKEMVTDNIETKQRDLNKPQEKTKNKFLD